MRQSLLLFGFIVALTYSTQGQSQWDPYRILYKVSDSLKAIGRSSAMDTAVLYKNIRELDRKHPSKFFETSSAFMRMMQYNEAAFTYYLGIMRYGYYNSANPKYQAGADGALLSSFKYVVGETINLYLKADIDNFIFVMGQVLDYYGSHDFSFFSKINDPGKFKAQIDSYQKLITELKKNKKKYRQEWANERKEMEAMMKQSFELDRVEQDVDANGTNH